MTLAPIQIPDVILRTVGRTPCTVPLAVVLHEWDSGIEQLDSAMQQCPRPRPTCPTRCHQSFHFGVGGNCNFHQYVPITDTAWGFAVTPPTCPEPICPPDPCTSCTGLTADQYNADVDGVLPTLPAFSADACGTANSCVVHVAVTNIFPTNASLGGGPCCAPNAAAYRCLVQSLCDIFRLIDLVPDLSTLLVHCSELVCLDLEQLIIDITTCLDFVPPPLPPCNCTAPDGPPGPQGPAGPTTPFTIIDTASVNLTTNGIAPGQNIQADVVISPNAGNQLALIGNGLVVPAPATVLPVGAACAPAVPFVGRTVLGQTVGLAPEWQVHGNQSAVLVGPAINPNASPTNIYLVNNPGGAVSLAVPTDRCSVYELWIKNINAADLAVTPTASTIDGVTPITLQGTSAGTYPFGNNGGEAVHLIYDFGSAQWYIL